MNDARTRGINAALVVVILVGLAYLAWAWVGPGRMTRPRFEVDVVATAEGLEIGRLPSEDVSAFLVSLDLRPLTRPLPAMEARLARRFAAALDELARKQGAAEFGRAGQHFHAIQDIAPAADCYERAMELDPSEQRWPYFLGRLEQREGHLDEAEALYGQALALGPELRTPALRLVQLMLRRGALDEARGTLERLLESYPGDPYARAELGRVLLQDGQPDAAIEELEAVVGVQPRNRRAHELLARAWVARGDESRAARHAALAGDGAGALDPVPDAFSNQLSSLGSSLRFLRRLGQAQGRSGDLPGLVSTYEEIVRRDPQVTSKVDLAMIYHQVRRTDRALVLLDQLLAENPLSPRPFEARAIIALDGGDPVEAVRWSDEALQRDPASPNALRSKLRGLEQQGKLDEAVSLARRAVELHPADPSMYELAGSVLIRSGRGDEAEALLQSAADRFPASNELRKLLEQTRED